MIPWMKELRKKDTVQCMIQEDREGERRIKRDRDAECGNLGE